MTPANTQPAFEAPPAPARHDGLAVLAKALGHPARLGIIAMLHEKQTCIGCDIVDAIGLAQSTTSEHLRILKAAGIIIGEIDPPRVCYSLNAEMLEPLRNFLGEIANTPAKGRQNRTKNKGRT